MPSANLAFGEHDCVCWDCGADFNDGRVIPVGGREVLLHIYVLDAGAGIWGRFSGEVLRGDWHAHGATRCEFDNDCPVIDVPLHS